jgi:4-aminobutyrate aminotransferase-like enzyme/Ser/Thr protein kinase RdoA (MazF antagonist)
VTTSDFLTNNGDALLAMLQRDFGLRGQLSGLPGEHDINVKLTNQQESFLVKVAPTDVDQELIRLQIDVLRHIATESPSLTVARVVPMSSGELIGSISTASGDHPIWVTTWIEGELFANFGDINEELCYQLGAELGKLDEALQSFTDARATRDLKWDLRQSNWIEAHLDAIDDPTIQAVIVDVHDHFLSLAPALESVRQGVIHNDANDYNVLVQEHGQTRSVGLIDLGDLCKTAVVGDVAIAATYAAMHLPDPLAAVDAVVRGFHASMPLTDAEVALVLPLIETRLAVSITNAAVRQRTRPDDPYVTISQGGAIKLLRFLHGRDFEVAAARLRAVCGLPAKPSFAHIAQFLANNGRPDNQLLTTAGRIEDAIVLDLSFGSTTGGDDPTKFNAAQAAGRIRDQMCAAGTDLAIGRYAEPRPIYSGRAFGDDRPNGNRRTVHLGIDVFAPAGTQVSAPLASVVHDTEVCEDHLDYGGLVILRHQLPDGTTFGTLYGHLDPDSFAELCPGQELDAGEPFAELGAPEVNGGWPPHLHLQVLAADPRDLPEVPRGVADPDDMAAHRQVYPDPSTLLGLTDHRAAYSDETESLQADRQQSFAQNLKTSYEHPIALVRGIRHFVFDSQGRKYLDAYNNVPHVGHCHPHVTRAVQEQTALLATNTRYLHVNMQRYAERLRAMLPEELSVFFFTPSGSEANELALRLVRKHTGNTDLCVMDHGYHGHTTSAMAMSPYKFRQPGAPPKPDWVHVTVQPDVYRGPHKGDDAGTRYAAEVAETIASLQQGGRRLAGYLCECLPSVGGQLELPADFLSGVYGAVRRAGGLCIADDVQTGLWRTGTHAFGFEKQQVVPDLLVLGKPLGNGFPLGCVVTTKEVAASFADGPEFFSTFGGSTVAMAAGLAVLDVLDDERLMDNARAVGDRLLAGLRDLQRRHEIIGDVRGSGLFLGVELVKDRGTLEPASQAASRIKNFLRDRRVLIGTDGPHDNVLKIRPPMTFDAEAADCLLESLERALASR